MQPLDQLDVSFCDLCGTSVPLQHLESGAALRHNGKLLGACCLTALRGATDGGVPSPSVATRVGGAAPESRNLALGIAVLGALAAATIFLDSRLVAVEDRISQSEGKLADRLKGQGDALLSLDGLARRADIDGFSERFTLADQASQQLATKVGALASAQGELGKALLAAVQRMAEAEQRRPDYGPLLTELRRELQLQAAAMAELKAAPRASAPPVEEVPSRPPDGMPDNGLPPALQQHLQKLKDEDPATRFVAVDELLRSKDVRLLEHLLPMATDADTFVRRLTVEGLKDYRQAAVVDVLLNALADPEEIVRDTAWRSLKDLTAQKLPFEATGSRDARVRAQQKWQEWWDKNRSSFGS